MSAAKHRGRCNCGAIRFTLRGPLRPVVGCHCSQCRTSTRFYVAATSARRADLEVTGDVTWFRSSDTAERGFCATCGSNLFWDGPGEGMSIMAGALDSPTGLALAGHIYCAHKGDYYDISGDLMQAEGADPDLTTMISP